MEGGLRTPRRPRCVCCNVWFCKMPNYNRRKTISTLAEAAEVEALLKKPVHVEDEVCDKCREVIYMKKKRQGGSVKPTTSESSIFRGDRSDFVDQKPSPSQGSEVVDQEPLPSDDALRNEVVDQEPSSSDDARGREVVDLKLKKTEFVSLPFKRVRATHKYCFIYGITGNSARLVPLLARVHCFTKTRIFIPRNNRCCRTHLLKNRFYDDELKNLHVHSHTSSISIDEVSQFLDQLCTAADKPLLADMGDYTMREEKLKVLTGLL